MQYLTNVTRGGIQNGSVLLLFATYQFGVDPLDLGLLRGAMAPAGIPFTFFAGYVMDRFGRKWSIVPGQTAMFLSMAFMAIIAFADLGWWMFVVAFVMSHLSISMLSGNMQTMGADERWSEKETELMAWAFFEVHERCYVGVPPKIL